VLCVAEAKLDIPKDAGYGFAPEKRMFRHKNKQLERECVGPVGCSAAEYLQE
jgi:hypothetical protein